MSSTKKKILALTDEDLDRMYDLPSLDELLARVPPRGTHSAPRVLSPAEERAAELDRILKTIKAGHAQVPQDDAEAEVSLWQTSQVLARFLEMKDTRAPTQPQQVMRRVHWVKKKRQ
jgi:hypothetical protein